MKEMIITEEEMIALYMVLRREWIQKEYQEIIYNLVAKLEKELEN